MHLIENQAPVSIGSELPKTGVHIAYQPDFESLNSPAKHMVCLAGMRVTIISLYSHPGFIDGQLLGRFKERGVRDFHRVTLSPALRGP